MISKQDRQGARTPANLEQKYAFGKTIAELEAITDMHGNQLSIQQQELTNFVSVSEERFESLENSTSKTDKNITKLQQGVSSLQVRMTNAEEEERKLSASVEALSILVSEVDETTEEALSQYTKKLLDLESLIYEQGYKQLELLVTVQVDSLNCESISADKNFAEIEEAILNGLNVRIELHSASENQVIYLQLASYQSGVEADFCGYYNGLPVVLQIMADEISEST